MHAARKIKIARHVPAAFREIEIIGIRLRMRSPLLRLRLSSEASTGRAEKIGAVSKLLVEASLKIFSCAQNNMPD